MITATATVAPPPSSDIMQLTGLRARVTDGDYAGVWFRLLVNGETVRHRFNVGQTITVRFHPDQEHAHFVCEGEVLS